MVTKWKEDEEVDQQFMGRHGRRPEEPALRLMRFLSHNPTMRFTGPALKERVRGINSGTVNNLRTIADRGKTGLRYEGTRPGKAGYFYWFNPEVKEDDITYVPPLNSGSNTSNRQPDPSTTRDKEEMTTSENQNANRGLLKLVTFHLADHPDQTFTSKHIADEFGVEIKSAQNALNTAVQRIPEVKRISRGMYRWIGPTESKPESSKPESEPEPEKEQGTVEKLAPQSTDPTTPDRLFFRVVVMQDDKLLLKDKNGMLWKAEKFNW